MRRFQMMLDDELDDALERRATEERTSKAELLRRYARDAIRPLPPRRADPLFRMVGVDSFEPVEVDEVVYG
jgi:hypothetical protein